MWDLVGNPEDQFSQNEAHLTLTFYCAVSPCLSENLSEVFDQVGLEPKYTALSCNLSIKNYQESKKNVLAKTH